MTFSEQLRAIRAEKHMTQHDAYTILEMPRRTYENWETGTATPTPYVQKWVIRLLEKPSE